MSRFDRFESGNEVREVFSGVASTLAFKTDYSSGAIIDDVPFDAAFLSGHGVDDQSYSDEEFNSEEEFDDDELDRSPSPVPMRRQKSSRRRRAAAPKRRQRRQSEELYSDDDFDQEEGPVSDRPRLRDSQFTPEPANNGRTRRRTAGGAQRPSAGLVDEGRAERGRGSPTSANAAYKSDESAVPFIDSVVWDPPVWNESRLAQAGFYVNFYGTSREFNQGTKRLDGGTMIDYTTCNIYNEDLMAHCRRNGENEYGSCNHVMRRVVQCRMKDNSIHPVMIRFKNVSNNLPFPVCVVAQNAPALNTVYVSIPNKSGHPVATKVMTVLPAASNIDEELVADMRRLIADPGMVYFMKLDKEKVLKQAEFITGDNDNERVGRVRHGQEFHKIVLKLCDDKQHPLRAQALAIKKAILKGQQNNQKVKRVHVNSTGGTDVGMWHGGIPMEPLDTIKKYISDKIDSVVKISELSLRIVPIYGEKEWMNPKMWITREVMNSRHFTRIGQLVNNPENRDGGSGASGRSYDIERQPEWDTPTGVSFVLDMKFL